MEIKSDLSTFQYRKRAKPKGRSLYTFHKKVKSLKLWYSKTFKNSLKQKELDQIKPPKHQKGIYFCDKYSTEEKYLKNVNLKKDNFVKKGIK